MKRGFLPLLMCLNIAALIAQVGVNTTSPHAMLDIRSSNQATPSNNDGILIPKIDAFPAVNPGADQDGMLAYLTTTVGNNLPGFYYWDNISSAWLPVGSNSGWSLSGNSGTVDGTNFLGTTDDIPLNIRVDNEQAGRIEWDINTANTSFGHRTLESNTGIYNTAFGYYSLLENTTGNDNTALGVAALRLNETGIENTAIGSRSLRNNTLGSRNTAVGAYSMQNNTTGNSNVAIGLSTLFSNTTGFDNISIGLAALPSNTTGGQNVAVGVNAMFENTTGSANNAIGSFALRNLTTGTGNVAVGQVAAFNITTGSNNVAIGREALVNDTIGFFNVAVGYRSLRESIGGNENTALGVGALELGQISNRNTAVGRGAMFNFGSTSQNTAVGYFALANQTFDNGGVPYFSNNTAVGFEALRFNNPTTTDNGNRNVAIGLQSLRSNTIGSGNTSIGFQNLYSNTTGVRNVGIGDVALVLNTLGSDNIGVGVGAAFSNSTAGNNIAIGTDALRVQSFNNGDVPYDTYNIAIGRAALFHNQPIDAGNSGRLNVGIGAFALNANTTGLSNTAIGTSSFRFTVGNSLNTGLGAFSGFYSLGGSNTYIGYFSGAGVSGTNTGAANTAVGHQSLRSITTGSQNTAIGDFALAAITTGVQNTALGAGASDGNQAGNRNTSIGMFSGRFGATIFTGSDNAYLGYLAGSQNSLGSNNTLLGTNSNVSLNNLTYATAIGSGAVVSQSNSIALGGNTAITRTRVGINIDAPAYSLHVNQIPSTGIGIQNGANTWELWNNGTNLSLYYNLAIRGSFDNVTGVYTSLSDRKLKSNIQDLENILDKVMELKASRYEFKDNNPGKIKSLGFIAQDVEVLFPEVVTKNDLSERNETLKEIYTLDYSGMSVIAIKALQEQQQIIEDLLKRVEELEEKLKKE